jgi:protein TonB
LNKQLQARQTPGWTPAVDVQALTAVRPLRPEYPPDALEAHIEGWVDLSFTVTPDGKVTNVVVVDQTPANTFERAARGALLATRYKPFMQDGRPVSVTSKIRVAFKMATH